MSNTVKGSVLLARRDFVEQNFGKGAWARAVGTLDAKDQRVLKGTILHTEWFPVGIQEHLDAAIVAVLAGGDRKVFEEIGAKSARANLETVHRVFLTPGNPQALLERAPLIYGLYYSTGRREYQATGPTSGVMTTYDAEVFSELDCLTVIGWHKEALRLCGAKNVVIREETCAARGGAFCRYDISWEM